MTMTKSCMGSNILLLLSGKQTTMRFSGLTQQMHEKLMSIKFVVRATHVTIRYEKIQLYKSIESNRKKNYWWLFVLDSVTLVLSQSTTFSWRFSVKTSTEKPRYIIVVFQTNKDGSQETNPSIFDHCNLKKTYIAKKEIQPSITIINNYNRQFSREYYDAAKFSEKFYSMNVIFGMNHPDTYMN